MGLLSYVLCAKLKYILHILVFTTRWENLVWTRYAQVFIFPWIITMFCSVLSKVQTQDLLFCMNCEKSLLASLPYMPPIFILLGLPKKYICLFMHNFLSVQSGSEKGLPKKRWSNTSTLNCTFLIQKSWRTHCSLLLKAGGTYLKTDAEGKWKGDENQEPWNPCEEKTTHTHSRTTFVGCNKKIGRIKIFVVVLWTKTQD